MSFYTWVIPSPAVPVTPSGGTGQVGSTRLRGRQWQALDLMIDPLTGDFIDTADGGWAETDDSTTAVMLQLGAAFGRWWGDPTSGSFITEIMRSEIPTIAEMRDEALRALQVLADAAVISDVSVMIDTDEAGRGALVLAYTDRQSGRPVDLAYVATSR